MANKNLDFKISIDANAKGQKEVQDLLRQLQQLKQVGGVNIGGLDAIPGQAKTASSSVAGLTRSFAALAAGIAVARGVFEAFAEGVRANADAQDRSLAITSLIASQYDLVDANGQVLTGQEAINAAKEKALGIETLLQKQSLASAASFGELLAAFKTVQAFSADLGTPEQLAELAPKLTDALKNFGFSGDAAASELKALFTGDQLDNAQFVRAQLGLTSKEQIQSLKEQGKLLDFLNEKLAAQALLSKEAAVGFNAQLGNAAEVVSKLNKELSQPLFASLTAGLTEFNSRLIDIDTGGLSEGLDGAISAGQDIQAIFGNIAEDLITGIVDRLEDVSAFLDENYTQWIDITSAIDGVFAGVSEIVNTVIQVVAGLAGASIESGNLGTAVGIVSRGVGLLATGFELVITVIQRIAGVVITSIGGPIQSLTKSLAGVARAAGLDDLAGKLETAGAAFSKIGARLVNNSNVVFNAFKNGETAYSRVLIQQEKSRGESLQRRLDLEKRRQDLEKKGSGAETRNKPKPGVPPKAGGRGAAGANSGETDEARIIEATAALEEERLENQRKAQAAGYQRQQKELEAALSAKEITFAEYLNRRADLQKAELNIDKQATQDRIAALQEEVAAARGAGKTLTALKKERELEKRVGELAAIGQKEAEIDAVLLIDGKKASEAQIKVKGDLEIDIASKLGKQLEADKAKIQKALDDALKSDEVRGNAELEALLRERAAIEERLAQQAQQSLLIERERTNLSLTQQEIERARVQGLITGVEAEARNRSAVLATTQAIQTKIQALETLAQASSQDDDTALLNQIRTLKGELEDLNIAANKTAIEVNRSFADSAVDGLDALIRKTTDLKGAFLSLAEAIVNDFAKRSGQALSDEIFKKISGQGGAGGIGKIFTDLLGGGFSFSKLLGFADGGAVRGPGTGTSDSILAKLSNGEFVVKADAVRQIGVQNLDYLNRKGRMPAFPEGGFVGVASVQQAAPAGNIRIINAIETQDIVNAIDSPAGEKVIKNIISRNRKFFKG